MPAHLEITQTFEELAGYHFGAMRAGMFNGTATIHVCDDGEWLVQSITLDCDNGKLGKEASGGTVELDRVQDARLFSALCKSLKADYADQVDDKISAAFADHGFPVGAMNAEHSTLHRVGV